MSLVELRAVTKTYASSSEGVTPLEELDFRVESGEFVALMGPSGSGKTTLLHLIGGIDRPSEGHVVVGGEEITAWPARRLARWRTRTIGYVFQAFHLIPVLTAAENVELPLTLLGMKRRERAQRVAVALDAVDLRERGHHLPGQLSGGQQQRVAIARAIVADPLLVLADEPTGNLDRHAADAILGLLRRLHDEFGKTLVMVTHDPAAAASATRTVHLDKGRIVEAAGEPHA